MKLTKSGIQAELDTIHELLHRYVEIVEEMTGAPAVPNEMFSAHQAAEYVARRVSKRGVDITGRGVLFRLQEDKLPGQKINANLTLYTRVQLDEYADKFERKPKTGRARKPVAL